MPASRASGTVGGGLGAPTASAGGYPPAPPAAGGKQAERRASCSSRSLRVVTVTAVGSAISGQKRQVVCLVGDKIALG